MQAVIDKCEFDEIAAFYDVMYSDRRDDVAMYVDFASEFGGPVLECGCGTGRVLIPIARTGIEIWGIDCSEKMLAIARAKLLKLHPDIQQSVRLCKRNMLDFQLEKRFRLCILPFRSFLHLLTPDQQNKALNQIYKHLRPNGRLVLDIFAPSHELLAKETTTLRFDEKMNSASGQKFNLADQVKYDHTNQLIYVERHYEHLNGNEVICRKVMPFTLRYIFRYELQALLEKNGFVIEKAYGYFDKRPYDHKSSEMIFVALKQN